VLSDSEAHRKFLVEPPAAAFLLAVPRTAGGFLSLLVQRKKPKKARPGAPAVSQNEAVPSVPRPTGRSPTRRAHTTRLGLKHGARLNTPGGAAVLGARYGVWNNTFSLPEFHSGGLAGFVVSVNTA
jgi:hypothetical protein